MNEQSKIWEDIFIKNKWGEYPPISLVKFISKYFYTVPKRSDIKILELGSGPGANIWYLRREGFAVFAIDYSKTACERAEFRLKSENLFEKASFFVGDYVTELERFEDNFFDAIIDIESLSCNTFEKSKKVLEVCGKKLKTKGLIFSQTFSEKTWGFDENEKEIDYHMVIPVSGPITGLGPVRYTTYDDIEKLYVNTNNNVVNIESQELHLSNKKSISEWLIVTEKT